MFYAANETSYGSKVVTLEAPGDCVLIVVLKAEQGEWADTRSLSLSNEAARILARQLQLWENRERGVAPVGVPIGCKEYGE